MTMNRKILFIAIFLLLTSCNRFAPVYNIESEPISSGSGKALSLEQIKSAIHRGVVDKTWTLMESGENRFLATYSKGAKSASVTITYSLKEYSIRYEKSALLSYDGTNIHNRYNSWIKGLRISINQQLVLL